VASWLNQQEEEHRFIILLGDSGGSAWSEVCVTQADILLACTDHESLPTMLEPERRCALPARHAWRSPLPLDALMLGAWSVA